MRVDFATVVDRSRCERGRPQNLVGHAGADYLGVDRLKPEEAEQSGRSFLPPPRGVALLGERPLAARAPGMAPHANGSQVGEVVAPPASGWTM